MTTNERTGKTLVYAHRGASERLPENTLEAFALALDHGADAIETDVHLTADGAAVLAHDLHGWRCARRSARISDSTLAEVKRWDVGLGWKKRRPDERRSFRMPTLEEALQAFPGVRFNVDIKPNDSRAALAVVEVLERLDAWPRACVASFHDEMTRLVRQVAPWAETSLGRNGVCRLALVPRRLLERVPIRAARAQVPTRAGPLRLDTRRFLEKAHAIGLAVDFWVVNDPYKARMLAQLGADGVMTDDPETIVPAVREGDKTREP